ncbi:MAG: cation transporter [Firmicutes bacterium]|nr:cation transporter [Bacillota bacterium]
MIANNITQMVNEVYHDETSEVFIMLLWLKFAFCTLLIVHSGAQLSKYGDILAEKTGAGRSIIGVVLLASVTSLPELVTGISAVTFANVPDIAVGDVLGSCVFNLFILAALLDAIYRRKPISTSAHHGHILSAAFGILLLCIVAISILFPQYNLPLWWIGSSSLLFVMTYFLALKLISSYEKKQMDRILLELAVELKYDDISTRQVATNFALNAAVVTAAATFLPKIGAEIASSTGLGETFVGNIFMALASSLPEVVVSIASVRMGAVDLAIGNLFGSNIFNILILAIDDLFFLQGPLLSLTNPAHIISAISAIAMTAISIIGLTYQAEKKTLPWGWDSIAMILVFVVNVLMLFLVI